MHRTTNVGSMSGSSVDHVDGDDGDRDRHGIHLRTLPRISTADMITAVIIVAAMNR